MQRKTLKSRIRTQLSQSDRQVFLRADFVDLAGYDQIGRALRQLTLEGTLMKVGHGLYAKSRQNRITGKPMLAATGGFAQVAYEALDRLGIKWEVTAFHPSINRTTQIQANAEVKIVSGTVRRIGTGPFVLKVRRD